MKKLILFTIVLLGISSTCVAAPPSHVQSSTNPLWKVGTVLTTEQVQGKETTFFTVSEIDDATFSRMQTGGSYPTNCTIARADLRYLRVLHYNFEGKIVCGELVSNKAIANDLIQIFLELFKEKYPIERMVLIDNYKANDESSMLANNTSSFCFRKVAGSKNLSLHARGMAIDINPLYNPCVKRDAKGNITQLQPNHPTARKYANHSKTLPHMITTSDTCYKLFIRHGFKWGGSWRTTKDYQHFEKR